jgi:ABC-type branched-subunit amino acid transport system substrate-binding protein
LEKAVKEKYDAPMHYAIIFGYDALNVMVSAIQQAGSLDPVKIQQALDTGKFQGLQGEITFEDFDGFQNQGRYTPVIVKWAGGKRTVAK